jgi:hypothetical protein
MLGFYENFPKNIHRTDSFRFTLSKKKIQQRFINVLEEVNRSEFSFCDAGNPTVPNCSIFFEVGIAEAQSFNFLDKEEVQKTIIALDNETFKTLDLFCAVRYYKSIAGKKSPLKFDYFMMRLSFGKENVITLQIFHERGPRYLSPEDLSVFIVKKVNEVSSRKALKRLEQQS